MTFSEQTDPDIVFQSSYKDVSYEVNAWDIPEGIALSITGFVTFDRMVLSITPDISHAKAQVITRAEYGKCLLEAARRLQKLNRPA